MSDDKTKVGADRKRISLAEDHERRHWAAKFGISEERLREVVGQAGHMVEDVERVLRTSGAGRPISDRQSTPSS